MSFKFRYVLSATLVVSSIILSACGASASNASTIGTAVALTVQAQNTQQAQFTPTPLGVTAAPSLLPPATPGSATQAPPTAPPTGAAGGNFCTASAAFVSETVPDGTIEQPGATFLKTWTIKNTGTCPWDSTWKFVFVSGDIMGGAYVYNFPQPAAPGDTVNIPIALVAPTADGQYTGYWKIQSPWGMTFGDSDSGNPFWVQIVVGSGTPGKGTATAYGITSVTYDISQQGDCSSANIFYTITATISSNGPLTITYHWQHSDGPTTSSATLTFNEATTKTVSDVWSVHLGSSNRQRWDQLVITQPFYQAYGKQTFTYPCH
jgi:hypothetical protein